MKKTGKNIAASVRQRLKNLSAKDKRPFSEILQYFAMERFLYRLAQSEHSDRFILKGALMLRVWQSPEIRATMDIDMLAKTKNDVENIYNQVVDIITINVEDGLTFHSDTVRGERITEEADYQGVRINFLGTLENARINMQLDIGFGDIIHPEPIEAELPTILDFPAPCLLCYSRESAIAEKFQAMIKLGTLNSRMKDFFDIWLLSRQFEFEGDKLCDAIRLTFDNRSTELPEAIVAFTPEFIEDKQTAWKAFTKKLEQEHIPVDFSEIVGGLVVFLEPIVDAITKNTPPPKHWGVTTTWT